MLTLLISRIVYLSSRHAWAVLGAFALLVLASGQYVVRHFAITTDVGQLIDAASAAAFPNRGDSTQAVVRAPEVEDLAGKLVDARLGIRLDFANIIALPLLLGVGVAFRLYYVVAWRAGQQVLLQHLLTQAIILSAATTATAFGGLWLSNHPGTASMGELLVLSLVCTLVGAVFIQPVLLGTPRSPPS
jgi:hypothetical protein